MKRLAALVEWIDKRFPRTGVAWLEVATLVVALIALLIACVKYFWADAPQTTELVKAVAWPVVVVVGLMALRGPIGTFLGGISQRVKKLEAFNVVFELTELKAKQAQTPELGELKRSTAMFVADSATHIFAQLRDPTPADYVVIDLGVGEEWLTSRLFIVAALLGRMRGVRCIVFTEGPSGDSGRFVGMAPIDAIRWQLGRKYPWFEIALAKATAQLSASDPALHYAGTPLVVSSRGAYEPHNANSVAQNFIRSLQVQVKPNPVDDTWLKIHDTPEVWERAEWVNPAKLRDLLNPHLSVACVTDPDQRRKQEVARIVLSGSGSFVASVTAGGKFQALFDRAVLLEDLARAATAEEEAAGEGEK